MFPLDGEDAGDREEEDEQETRRDYGLHFFFFFFLLPPMRLRTSVIRKIVVNLLSLSIIYNVSSETFPCYTRIKSLLNIPDTRLIDVIL